MAGLRGAYSRSSVHCKDSPKSCLSLQRFSQLEGHSLSLPLGLCLWSAGAPPQLLLLYITRKKGENTWKIQTFQFYTCYLLKKLDYQTHRWQEGNTKQGSRQTNNPSTILTLCTKALNRPWQRFFQVYLPHFSLLALSIEGPLPQTASVEVVPVSRPPRLISKSYIRSNYTQASSLIHTWSFKSIKLPWGLRRHFI